MKKLFFVILVSVFSSCSSITAPIPSTNNPAVTTQTNLQTSITIFPSTPSITPSPTGEVKMVDLPQTKSAVDQFAAAMKSAGVYADAEQIRQGLTTKKITGRDEKIYEIAITQDGYPLMVKAEGGEWQEVDLRNFSRIAGIESGTTGTYFNESDMPAGLEKFAFNHYGSMVTEMDLLWNRLEKENNLLTDFRVKHVNELIKKTSDNGGKVIAGNLIYWEGYPDWLINGNFSKDELKDFIKDYFRTIAQQFPQISTWIVLNEYHSLSLGYHPDYLQQRLGYDLLLELAFESAQTVNPNGILIYSDGHNHSMNAGDTNGATFYKTKKDISYLQSKNIKNLAVGMHMHLDAANPPQKEDMVSAMQNYGVPIYILELDVNLKDVKNSKNIIQAKIYEDVMSACLESGTCKFFGTWGTFDGNNWLEVDPSAPGYSKDANPTPFDDKLEPKMAYYAVLQSIYNWLE